MTKKLQLPQNPPAQEPCSKSIYRIPKILTDVNSHAFKPNLASFGPYHNNCHHFYPMEEHKHRALIQFLRRIAKDQFLKVMIVDGCFALEIMLADKRFASGEQSEYDSHDPIFGVERMIEVVPRLKRDMLILENQLPLLALTTLATIDGSEIQSATKLKNAGVLFCKSKTNSLRDISFNGDILSLPQLEVDDTTESSLLNLMAFERLHETAGNEVTAYVFFMDGLIKTVDDVALLRNEEIIKGLVHSDENIFKIFSKITKEATLAGLMDDIIGVNSKFNTYYKKMMHWWRTNFVETYLESLWVFISPYGGLLLLALTIFNTMCTILRYYKA
ncbi:UPF0481 protein [Dendrobium catenatum]|uniref:UPF0481 protein n=1 Tax=Dendrobium catenatum TaxID=906689 RepID=A0A2I0WG00_9ASPA|nr:UPF0481 protein [Dendrobium catenatum]